MLRRKTLAPVSMSSARRSGESVAGPSVTMILVLRNIVVGKCVVNEIRWRNLRSP